MHRVLVSLLEETSPLFAPLKHALKRVWLSWLKPKPIYYTYNSNCLFPGFLTDDLVTAEDDGHQKKYLGVCKLPGEGRKVLHSSFRKPYYVKLSCKTKCVWHLDGIWFVLSNSIVIEYVNIKLKVS